MVPNLSGFKGTGGRDSGLDEQRVVPRFLPLHSRRPGTSGAGSWRSPAHLGFHQLLLDAFGRVLAVVQLLQLALSPLLRLADVLQKLSGLRAGFHGLKGEGTGERWPNLSTEKDGDHLLNRKKNRVTLNGYFYPFFKTYKRFILFCVSPVLRCTYIYFFNIAEFGMHLRLKLMVFFSFLGYRR